MAPSNAKPIGGTYKRVADDGLLIIIGNVVGTRNDVCDVCEWSVGGRSENMVVIEDRVSLEICTMHVKLRIVFNIGGRKQHCEVKKKASHWDFEEIYRWLARGLLIPGTCTTHDKNMEIGQCSAKFLI